MPTSTIFIASSEKGKPLAEALASRLRQEMPDGLVVREWWVDCFGLGKNTLETLIEHCRRSDFAAVLLTKDDVIERDNSPAPRDNCVFEAGMFTGVFGAKGKGERGEAERCFLISSVAKEHLLTDLSGITVQRIEELKNSQSINLAASRIRDSIRDLGPVSKPELECYTEEALMEREQVGGVAGTLEWGSEVLVNLTRPIEVDLEFARRVFRNLQENVHYKYLFSAAENLRPVAQLVYSVTKAAIDATGPARERFKDEKVERIFERIRRQLSIWFLPERKPFEFCIHNFNRDKAVCYLRRPSDGKFVDWCSGDRAIQIGQHVEGWLISPPPPPPWPIDPTTRPPRDPKPPAPMNADDHRVFRSAEGFDLYANEDKRLAIESELRALFDERDKDACERVLDLCFGERIGIDPSSVAPR